MSRKINYFEDCKTKPSARSDKELNTEDARLDLLVEHYNGLPSYMDTHVELMDRMFLKWTAYLFSGFNVAVRGPMSKYRILETFKAQRLDSEKLLDLDAKDGSTYNITTVRMHGMDNISMEYFNNQVFGFEDSNRVVTDQDIRQFVKTAKAKRMHYVFMIHSYELFYKQWEPICDLIFQLYEQDPSRIHLLISLDHINSAKILKRLEYRFVVQDVIGESFIFEKANLFGLIGNGPDKFGSADKRGNLFGTAMDIQSLTDVYQAVPEACQKILIFLLKDYMSKSGLVVALNSQAPQTMFPDREESMKPKSRRSTRGPSKRVYTDTDLEFNTLFTWCQEELFIRSSVKLRDYLGELSDHSVIEYDEVTNKVKCLVSYSTCEKFIPTIEGS